MKIEKIDIPEETASGYGLKPVKMERLNHVVLIAGKNGAGKSRLLTMLKNIFQTYPDYKKALDLNNNITQLNGQVVQWNNQISQHEKNLSITVNEQQKRQIEVQINSLLSNIASYENNITGWKKELKYESFIHFNPGKLNNHLIDFVPKSLQLKDSYTMTAQDVDNSSRFIYSNGIQNISNGTGPPIEKIQKRWINAISKSTEG